MYAVTQSHCINIPAHIGEASSDLLQSFFKYLNFGEVLDCRLVNRRWRQSLESSAFWQIYFPVVDVARINKTVNNLQLYKIIDRYHNPNAPQNGLPKLTLRQNMSMQHMIHLKLHSLKLVDAGFESIYEVKRLTSPAVLKIKNHGASFALPMILDRITSKKIKYKKLTINYTDPYDQDVWQQFAKLVVKSLDKPCTLDFKGQKWFTSNCVDSLIVGGAKIRSLNVQKINFKEKDVLKLINNNALISPCALKAPIEKEATIDALLAKGIKMRYLDIPRGASEQGWIRLIEQGLDTVCKVKIDSHYSSTKEILKSLINCGVKIRLLEFKLYLFDFILCSFDSYSANLIKLLKQVEKFHLIIDEESYVTGYEFRALEIEKFRDFLGMNFTIDRLTLCSAAVARDEVSIYKLFQHLRKDKMHLRIQDCLPQAAFNYLMTRNISFAHVDLKHLPHDFDCASFSEKALSKCKVVKLPKRGYNVIKVLDILSKTDVKKLYLHLNEEAAQHLVVLLKTRKLFPYLSILKCNRIKPHNLYCDLVGARPSFRLKIDILKSEF